MMLRFGDQEHQYLVKEYTLEFEVRSATKFGADAIVRVL